MISKEEVEKLREPKRYKHRSLGYVVTTVDRGAAGMGGSSGRRNYMYGISFVIYNRQHYKSEDGRLEDVNCVMEHKQFYEDFMEVGTGKEYIEAEGSEQEKE